MNLVKVRRIDARTLRFTKYTSLLAAAAMTLAGSAHALPVIPGASGFGIDTPAGRGGKVYRVTNLKASGAGSLQACIDGTAPRVCVFEVSGVIRVTQDVKIRTGRITIAGQTAPSPGIMIRGGGLQIQASDVLVQHIRVRAGDDPNGPDPDNRDSLKIQGDDAKPVTNVVIDHCSFSWSIDEVASVWGTFDNIVFLNNMFSEPLDDSLHRSDDGTRREKHGFGVLFGTSPTGGHVTFVGNLMAHQVERNPLSRAPKLVFVNNMIYNRSARDYENQSERRRVTKNSVVGNVFVRGPSYENPTHPIVLRTSGSLAMGSGSKVYLHDNDTEGGGGSASQPTYIGGDIISGLTASTAPVWPDGLRARSTANNAVYDRVLKYAGARPADRDSVDKRIVNHVKARSGGIINCVADNGSSRCSRNAGGWPYYAQHTRRLTLPSNPNSVASNGYTRLENWLHSMDQTVQGITAAESPTASAALSVR